ncbi:MAG: nucleotidyltransferase family protein [Casimicrobium sp.]
MSAAKLVSIIERSSWFTRTLLAARELNLKSWCIGAGAIRNLVWDHLHGYAEPSNLADVDVAYFDSSDLSQARDDELQARLVAACPESPWEVTNQAAVHLWFESYFGHAVSPLRSLEEAVGTWPEYATSVGVFLDMDDEIHVIAPHGLDDLFNCVVRRNPTRVSIETYQKRVATKRYSLRWSKVTIVP